MAFVPPGAAAVLSTPGDDHQYIRAGGPTPKGFAYNLTFEVGVSYITGLAGGSVYGGLLALNEVRPGGKQAAFPLRLKLNQVMNSVGRYSGQTGNGFAVFALTYSLTRDLLKFQVRATPVDDPMNEAIGAGVAGTIQGLTRFPRIPALGCGLALGAMTYGCMKYGMESIKKTIPFERL